MPKKQGKATRSAAPAASAGKRRAGFYLDLSLIEALEAEVVRLRKEAGPDSNRAEINQSMIVAAALTEYLARKRKS